MNHPRRRQFLIAAGSLLAAPAILRAQERPAVRRIGFLATRARSTSSNPDLYYDTFVRGLKEQGYVEGQNLIIEWRYAENRSERWPDLAADLVKSKVEVIVTHGTPPTLAVRRVTSTIPIVAISISDPVGSGFAASLARPNGNVTGTTNIIYDSSSKMVELLKTLLSKLTRAAVLLNPENPTHSRILENLQSAARVLAIDIVPANVRNPDELVSAFDVATKARAQAIIVAPDPMLAGMSARIASLALSHRLPTMSGFPEDANSGILICYGQSNVDRYLRAATYVDKILKGARPSDLPFEQTTLIELAVNVKTAGMLGVKVPTEILMRADRVIK